jgi:hypothetical protein
MRALKRRDVWSSADLEKRLSAYAGAAAASGVSLLALATPARARIVYTPADTKIVPNGERVVLDLNHDGIGDFYLTNFEHGSYQSAFNFKLRGSAPHSNTIRGRGHFRSSASQLYSSAFASALHAGSKVGPSKIYFRKVGIGQAILCLAVGNRSGPYYGSFSFGEWMDTRDRYLGLKFMIDGEVHYGWARLNVGLLQNQFGIQAVLTGYAYETVPNKPIIAGATRDTDAVPETPDAALTVPTPAPATLGALALGAPGLSIWRREDSVAATPDCS